MPHPHSGKSLSDEDFYDPTYEGALGSPVPVVSLPPLIVVATKTPNVLVSTHGSVEGGSELGRHVGAADVPHWW